MSFIVTRARLITAPSTSLRCAQFGVELEACEEDRRKPGHETGGNPVNSAWSCGAGEVECDGEISDG